MSVTEQQMQQCPNCGEYVPADYVVCVYCGFDLTSEIIKRSKIKISYIEAIKRDIKLLTNPFQGMKEIAFLPDQKGPFVNLYLIAILITLQVQIIVSKFYTNLSLVYSSLIHLIIFITMPLLLYVLFFITLRLFTWLTVLMMRIIGAKNIEKHRVKSVLGYSSFALVLGQTIGVFLKLLLPRKTVTIDYVSIKTVLSIYENHPLMYINNFFSYAAWIYATVLATYGLAKAGKISYFEAFLTIIPVIAISFSFIL